jgi:hypothetical protein
VSERVDTATESESRKIIVEQFKSQTTPLSIAERLEMLRLPNETDYAFCKRGFIHISALRKWRAGERANILNSRMFMVAIALNVSYNWLCMGFTMKGEPATYPPEALTPKWKTRHQAEMSRLVFPHVPLTREQKKSIISCITETDSSSHEEPKLLN